MTNIEEAKVVEIVPGALRRRPVIAPSKPEPCRRPHVDPDPCYDIEVEADLFGGRRKNPEMETVHIPGCMGCAAYGHDDGCTCEGQAYWL